MAQDNTVMMEGVQIIFKNFEGRKSEFNQQGRRQFGVLLDTSIAEMMLQDDWNVKTLKPREDADEGDDTAPQQWLPVELRYDAGRPPRVVVIDSQGKRKNLNEETVGSLDWADIVNVDLIVNPSHWNVNGKSGVKAYLRSMYVIIEEDALERKYEESEVQA